MRHGAQAFCSEVIGGTTMAQEGELCTSPEANNIATKESKYKKCSREDVIN